MPRWRGGRRSVEPTPHNETNRFYVFVANKVQEIRQHTEPHQWRYIESESNPADLASRGASARELINSTLWWHGPILLTAGVDIPDTEQDFKVPSDDPEVKSSSFRTAATQQGKDPDVELTDASPQQDTAIDVDDENENEEVVLNTKGMSDLPDDAQMIATDETHVTPGTGTSYPSLASRLEYFSNWHRARKSVALCQRYKTILARKLSSNRHVTGVNACISTRTMTVDDLYTEQNK